MTTINEKRKYAKPSMKVYELRQAPQLLAGSGERDPYIPTEWPES
jgi:hypothetical protein